MPGELLLNSWKEIAGYMGRSERTVQRWEKYFGLPVRRPAGRTRSAVIALPSEIQAWSRNVPKKVGDLKLDETVDNATQSPSTALTEWRPTLLCIDDHAEGLAVRRVLLEAMGYQVLTANSGRAGLRILEKESVDLVLLGHSSPDLSSEAVVRLLHESKPRVPILLLSGTGEIAGPLMRLVDSFVQKGQPVAMLLTAIGELCAAQSKSDLASVPPNLDFQASFKPVA
ncbi:MAG TPA: response regulator [Verrucomicrobiae bacterium]|nr:response regulator [Verrucomicrobiae bacterium]